MRYVLWLTFVGLVSCGRSPYDDLEDAFRAPTRLRSKPIASRTMVLVSRRHRGAFNYRNNVNIRVSRDAVEIAPSLPWLDPITVPASSVTACSASSFGGADWDADLLIASVETEVSIHASSEIVGWCWQNRIPAASGEERRGWLYRGGSLPSRGAPRTGLSSRAAYDERIRQARLGY